MPIHTELLWRSADFREGNRSLYLGFYGLLSTVIISSLYGSVLLRHQLLLIIDTNEN